MRVLDLSGPIYNGMWSYGSPLPDVRVEPLASLETVGWSGHLLHLHTLTGTYLETADHLFPGRETIAEVSVDRFIKKAWVAQLTEKEKWGKITADELNRAVSADFKPGDALLIATGWDQLWGHEDFVRGCPFFLPEVMEWVIEKDVGLLGLDIPSVQDPRMDDNALNRLFFAKDRLLLAPLVGLRKTGKGPGTLIALPLPISDVCGTPCRAVFLDEVITNS
ncbi:cyclase family protein [Paenibacillus qinlingensis]|uniref:cyclase family protein n=1 Tax=Paenibacillus qinlingensis TaxID=1837343 RepID=UPI001566D4ED|nr:cyclase family protein [Paenibacillus qinlingensis]NQX64241.1 cyclase family protein [Paenibacillus qinlingensis]